MLKIVKLLILTLLLTISMSLPAYADYSTGFKSPSMQITAPTTSGFQSNGVVHVKGTSTLDRVWFCVRGPANEVKTCSTEVNGGSFEMDLQLCFGPGKYTIWAGDNNTQFEGLIRFEVFAD